MAQSKQGLKLYSRLAHIVVRSNCVDSMPYSSIYKLINEVNMNNNWENMNRFAWELVQLATQLQQQIENEQKLQLEGNHDTQQ
jgi:hypothetical protein